jgi:hypothetical protein
MNPIGAMARGKLAGAVGMAAMDLFLYRRYRRDGGSQALLEWEFSGSVDDWDGAPAPAQVGKLAVERLFRTTPDPRWARTANNVVHWATGAAWGAQFGLLAAAKGPLHPAAGVAFGAAVWANSYVVLPLLKVNQPIWQYDARTLAKDLSAHVVYGVVTAETFRLLDRRRR